MDDIEVVCIGAAKYDTVVRTERLPVDDERMLTDSLLNAAGGNANTAAVTLAKLGVRVALVAVIGNDYGGDFVMGRLEEAGVDTRYVERRAGVATPQSINIATASTGGRVIVTVEGIPNDPSVVMGLTAPWIHVDADGFSDTAELRKNKSANMKFSVDAGIPIPALGTISLDLYAPTLSRLEVDFRGTTPRDLMEQAHALGAKDIVATNGAEGCFVLSEGVFTVIPAFTGPIVSTLGAGDVFHGALVAGAARGLSMVEAARQASAAAFLSCRAIDGQSGIPSRAELDTFLNEQSNR